MDLGKGEVDLSRDAGAPGISGTGPLVRLTFISLGKGDASIRIAGAALLNSKNEAIAGESLPEVTVKIQ